MCKTFTKNYILKFQINNEIILREENQKKYQNDWRKTKRIENPIFICIFYYNEKSVILSLIQLKFVRIFYSSVN